MLLVVGIILIASLSGDLWYVGVSILIVSIAVAGYGGFQLHRSNNLKKELCKMLASMDDVFILGGDNRLWRGQPSEVDIDDLKLITAERANGIRRTILSPNALDSSIQSNQR